MTIQNCRNTEENENENTKLLQQGGAPDPQIPSLLVNQQRVEVVRNEKYENAEL